MKSARLIALMTIVGAIFLLGQLAPVSAATLYVKKNNNRATLGSSTPWTFPNEAFKTNTFNACGISVNSLNSGEIQYVPDANLANQDVVFSLSNSALFQNPNTGSVYMLYDSKTNQRVTSANGTALVASISTTTLKFPSVTLAAGHTYYLIASASTAGATNTINFTTSSGTTPAAITLSVAQANTYNQASTPFLTYGNYWVPSVANGKAAGVIDVAAGRKLFTNSGTSDTVTAAFATGPNTTLYVDYLGNSAGYTATANFITINTLNTFSSMTFSLGVVDNTGIQKVEWIYGGGTPEQLTYDAANQKYTKVFTTSGKPVNTDTGAFKITIDQSTVLNTRSFTYSLAATGNTGYPNTTYLDKVDAGSWTLNGYQAVCPYVNTNNSFGTQFILNNAGSTSADVFWDTVSSSNSVVAASLSTYSNKQVTAKTTIPAHSTMLFDAAEVISALGIPVQDASGNYARNALRVTVTGSKSQITGIAVQSDGTTGKRTEPLFPSADGSQNAVW